MFSHTEGVCWTSAGKNGYRSMIHKTDEKNRNIPATSRIAACAADCERPMSFKAGIKFSDDNYCVC